MINLIGISGHKGSGKNTVAYIIQYLAVQYRKEGSIGWHEEELSRRIIAKETREHNLNGFYWQQKAFSEKLRTVCSIISGIPVSDFENEIKKEESMPEIWKRYVLQDINENLHLFIDEATADLFIQNVISIESYHKIGYQLPTLRKFLQWVGTDCFRDIIHPQTWINALFADYKLTDIEKRQSMGTAIDYSECFPKWLITDCRFPNEAEAIKQRGGIIIRVERPDLSVSDLHQSEIALDNYPFFNHTFYNNGPVMSLILQIKIWMVRCKLISFDTDI